MVYGILLNWLLLTLLSHAFFSDFRPKLQFDRRAAGEMLRFTKFTVPSSWLTLPLSQFDKNVVPEVIRSALAWRSLTGYHFFASRASCTESPYVARRHCSSICLWLQRAKGMMIVSYEFFKVAFALAVAMSAYLTSGLLLTLWQTTRNRI
jgi:hypothetical protein